MATIFQDSFDRTDSDTAGLLDTGGTWVESDCGADQIQIVSNQLSMRYESGHTHTLDHKATVTHVTKRYEFYMSFYLDASGGSTTRQSYIGMNAAVGGTGGVVFNFLSTNASNNTTLRTNWFTGATAAGQVDWTTAKYVWLDCIGTSSSVVVNLYVSATSTKPGSVTLTATDTPDTTVGNVNMIFWTDYNATVAGLLVNNLLVTDTAPATGPANLKSLNTNLKANIKSYNTNLIANVKSINTNV